MSSKKRNSEQIGESEAKKAKVYSQPNQQQNQHQQPTTLQPEKVLEFLQIAGKLKVQYFSTSVLYDLCFFLDYKTNRLGSK